MSKVKNKHREPEDLVRLIDINREQAILGRVDDEKYKPKKGEEGAVHVELESVMFQRGSGLKISKPFIMQCNTRQWPRVKPNLRKLGYTYVKVLHAPKGVEKFTIEPMVRAPNQAAGITPETAQ